VANTTWESAVAWLHEQAGGEPREAPEIWPSDAFCEYGPEPRAVAVDKVLGVGDLAIISGPYDTFKSSFALELAHSLATAEPFLGRFAVDHPLRTLVIQCEIDAGSYRDRVRQLGGHPDLLVWNDYAWSFERLGELPAIVDECGVEAIVFDPIGQMWPRHSRSGEPFNENLKTHVSPLLKVLRLLGPTIILVHHDPKKGQVENRAAGSSALLNDPDTRIFLDEHPLGIGVRIRTRLQASAGRFTARFYEDRRRLRFLKKDT